MRNGCSTIVFFGLIDQTAKSSNFQERYVRVRWKLSVVCLLKKWAKGLPVDT